MLWMKIKFYWYMCVCACVCVCFGGISYIATAPNPVNNCMNTLQWRHNRRDSVSNHQPHGCLLNRLFRSRSKKTSKLRVTGLCAGNSPGTGEFPAQMANNTENGSIWWRHHDCPVRNPTFDPTQGMNLSRDSWLSKKSLYTVFFCLDKESVHLGVKPTNDKIGLSTKCDNSVSVSCDH